MSKVKLLYKKNKIKIHVNPEDRAPLGFNTSIPFSFPGLKLLSVLWEWSQAEATGGTRKPNAPASGLEAWRLWAC